MNKISTQKPKGLLHSLPIPDRPWQLIGINFMGPLPKSNDCNYLMVVIDCLTSHVHLVPPTTMVTGKGIAWLFLKEIVRLHGVLDSIVSDRDSKFTSIFLHELQLIIEGEGVSNTTYLHCHQAMQRFTPYSALVGYQASPFINSPVTCIPSYLEYA
jgi:hypothetical protein